MMKHKNGTWRSKHLGSMLSCVISHYKECQNREISEFMNSTQFMFGFSCKCGLTWSMMLLDFKQYGLCSDFGRMVSYLEGREIMADKINSGGSLEEIREIAIVYETMNE